MRLGFKRTAIQRREKLGLKEGAPRQRDEEEDL